MKLSHLPLLLVLLVAWCAPGCKSSQLPAYLNPWHQRQQDVPPVLFTSIPPKEELVAAVNYNNSRVQRLQAQNASVSIAGFPSLPTEIAIERPNKFRFRAASSLLGNQVDMGSNDEMLWFWTAQSSPPNVYFGRHEQLAASPARRQLAIDPSVFVEALGLIEISPQQVVGEPTAAGKDRLQLVCRQMTPAGEITRTLQIHKQHGYLLEQQIVDAQGRPMLNSRLSQQRHYKVDGVTLPHRIDLHVPSGDMRVQIDVQQFSVNQEFTNGAATFAFPREQLGQYQLVDIADPNFMPPGAGPPASYSGSGGAAGAGMMPTSVPRYRGSGY